MVPDSYILTTSLEEPDYGDATYQLVIDQKLTIGNDVYKNRIKGVINELDAVKQAVYLMLGTERYKFPIYSWDYGIELVDLYGKPMYYVKAELPKRIKEALLIDNRISDVSDFEFSQNGNKITVSFTITTTSGSFINELEVTV